MSKPKPKKKRAPTLPKAELRPLKLDLGCGPNPKDGFVGVDVRHFDKVGVVCNLGKDTWPWEESSVDEVHSSHFLEHLTAAERCHFANELYRVLKPETTGASALIITPNWSSARSYGDPTHQWPPVSEFMHFYLDRPWRLSQAPHTDKKWNPHGYDCDFLCTWGFGMHQSLLTRNADYQRFAFENYIEAKQDTVATWKAMKPMREAPPVTGTVAPT